jgi:hypothetical protein
MSGHVVVNNLPLLSSSTPASDAPASVVRVVNGAQQTTQEAILSALQGSTSPARDAFGRERAVSPVLTFSNTTGYDAEPLVWQTIVSGAGATATWSSSTRSTPLTLTTVTGYVVRQTYVYIPYQPGRSQFITMTGVIGAAVANVTKRIGQFDQQNGLFFCQTTAGILQVVRRSAGVDTAIAQADWNLDRFDGTGTSGVTLDLTKDQIFVMDYGWLGTATVRFGFYYNGNVVYAHAMHHANVLTTSYIQTACLPLRYEISSSGNATALLTQICAAVSSEGGYYDVPAYAFGATREISGIIATTSEVPIVALRPLTTFNGVPNRIRIIVTAVDILASAAPIRYRLLYYPPGSTNPVTGGAWAAAASASGAEVNTTGTALSLTGAIAIQGGFVGAGAGATNRAATSESIVSTYPVTIDASGASSPLTSNAGANPAYIVLSALGAGASACGQIDWEEIR